MITDDEARQLLFDWHGGQFTPTYEAASSGLITSWDNLLFDVEAITSEADRTALKEWLAHHQGIGRTTGIDGVAYAVLPWHAGD